MARTHNKPLRILQVYAALARGGAETWLMDVMRNASRKEWQFDVCLTGSTEGAYEDEFKSLGGKIHRCPLSRNLFGFSQRFRQVLTAEQYDVVHSHLYYFSGLVLRLAAQAGVPKRIAHIHPVEDFKAGGVLRSLYTLWMKRWIIRYGTDFVGPTKGSLEGFWGPGWEEDPKKHVIYNGVCPERFIKPVDRASIRTELKIPENAPIVLNVSSYRPHKRHEFLVQVAQDVLAKRRDVYFLLIGAGKLKEAITQKVRSKGLEKNFRLISGAPSIDRYFLASDVFAFPSCNEGFGIAIIEAALAGLKIIVQDIPGVQEAAAVCQGATLLPLDTSSDKWAQELLNVLKEPKMEEEQRQMFLRQFPLTIKNSVAKLREIYND